MGRSAIAPTTRRAAQAMRRAPTEAERRLWLALRELRPLGVARLRRQAPVGPFVADFADLSRRVVVEVDGGQHGGPEDAQRDAWFEAGGWLVLRFWNHEVLENVDGVTATIAARCAERAAPPPTPPRKGEGSASGDAAAPDRKGRRPRRRAPSPLVGEGRGGGLPARQQGEPTP